MSIGRLRATGNTAMTTGVVAGLMLALGVLWIFPPAKSKAVVIPAAAALDSPVEVQPTGDAPKGEPAGAEAIEWTGQDKGSPPVQAPIAEATPENPPAASAIAEGSRGGTGGSTSGSSSYSPGSSSGGRVSVRGYYRKNGTYVRPHTRSAPRSRR